MPTVHDGLTDRAAHLRMVQYGKRLTVMYIGAYLIVAALVPIAPEVKTWLPLSTKAYASSSIICRYRGVLYRGRMKVP